MATLKEMLDHTGSMESAEAHARQLIDQHGSKFLMDLALLLCAQGKHDESYQLLLDFENIYPDDVRAIYNLGWHVMRKGDMLHGFQMMNRGRGNQLWGNAPISVNKPIWEGQPLEGKIVLFYCEAGLGDSVVFIRFAEELAQRGARVVIACSQSLMPIFARLPWVSSCIMPEVVQGVHCDYWVPSMLAPVLLEQTFKDIDGGTYLIVNQEYKKKYAEVINPNQINVGVRWLGQPGDDYITRVFPEQLLFDAVSVHDINVYSLQKDALFPPPDWVVDMDKYMETWDDTMGIIANLDLVITSCTSIAHIAGAMGKATWVVIPAMPYFIWSYPMREMYSIWYDSVMLFRQEKWGEWELPFNQIHKALKLWREHGKENQEKKGSKTAVA